MRRKMHFALQRFTRTGVVTILCGSCLLLLAKDFTPAQRKWWAFQKVVKPAVPDVSSKDWIKTPVDAFVRAKLDEKGLKPNPPADKVTLLRRVSLDLTGLPPSPADVQSFLADTSPQAYAKVVDRLLASPRYGERWGRHWLDLARYADSEGFKSDETRPNIWRYRDYVIRSFNEDKPYDRFIREQIAGDELYPNDPEALIATGFNRHFPDESNARNLMQRRQEILNDITDTVGATFLGLTYGCARCHDHKFDPILQKDYYRLQAFFANTRIDDQVNLMPSADREAWEKEESAWDAKTKDIRAEIDALLKPELAKLYKENFDKFPEEIQAAITTPEAERTPIQWIMYHKAKPQLDHTDEEAAKRLHGEAAQRYRQLRDELARYDSIKPPALPIAQAMIDNGSSAPKTFVLASGAYDRPLEEVQPGFLSILNPAPAKIVAPEGMHTTGRRSALAEWLADANNPLTARVMVNRIWYYNFGRGIAGTPSDFGVMGERPGDKDLLDYLAATFVENGWSVKKIQRLICLSNTYQESSLSRDDAAKLDPDDKYFWRYPRHRLEGESIRDSILYTAGILNEKMGGPGVFPPLPPGVTARGGWKVNEDPSEALRRSVYIFVRRNVRYPMLVAFDAPDTFESCSRRNITVTPTQTLELLNDNLVLDWARHFAGRVLNDGGLTPAAQIERAYKPAFSRPPDSEERKLAEMFLNKQIPILAERMARGDKVPVPDNIPSGIEPARAAAFVDLCHMLFNANEFIYIN
ncbi:MAG TPA: DUF1549 and DUF1553 domain-containing protein [Bryobacteraceae bacterium]|nr:DUF1549 and DUF1553 domain-containing protein [Bryobacteraceae bacterium]